MSEEYQFQAIARVHSDFTSKFGIPRQSGLVNALTAEIIFEPAFRNPEMLRELSGFSHIWLIWVFDRSIRQNQKDRGPSTVRPPRLGGNRRVGVFASRSPFRPNPIGLSVVKLDSIEWDTVQGPVLHIRSADLADRTPILDIKPYLPYSDSHPEAVGGFASNSPEEYLEVEIPAYLLERVPVERREALFGILALDPRPRYHAAHDSSRIYGFGFAGLEIRFSVSGTHLIVQEIQKTIED